jgi:glyoxylase-like metal-dependent hydrolase (beta-lactamase superfamily II)
MKLKAIAKILCISFAVQMLATSQERDFSRIKVKHLGERAIVISGTQFDTNQLIVKSKKGLILVDSGISPQYAEKLRDIATREFNCTHFAYVINTHHHWDHVQGNQEFPEAIIVGHENCGDKMRGQKPAELAASAPLMKVQEEPEKTSSDTIPPPPPSHILVDGVNGYSLTTPDISFSNRLKIVSEDLTVHLLWYGECHTNNDILIYFPEESILAAGDLFYKKSLPPFGKRRDLDISQWIKTLDWILSEGHSIKSIVPGHDELLEREDLVLYRNYIHTLWRGIEEAVSAGKTLPNIQEDFSLQNKFPELIGRDHTTNSGGSLHRGNVKAIWNQIIKDKAE